jgi:hypothetical protein
MIPPTPLLEVRNLQVICGDVILMLRGVSPVKDVFDVTIAVHTEDPLRVGTARPAAVGAVIGISYTVSVVVALLPAAFDGLWMLAISGHPRSASLTLIPPKHGSALVINAGFSSEREE